MFGRFKYAFMSATNNDNESAADVINPNIPITIETKPYSRPAFLSLTNEEAQVITHLYILFIMEKNLIIELSLKGFFHFY
jgi:hypothetical protein